MHSVMKRGSTPDATGRPKNPPASTYEERMAGYARIIESAERAIKRLQN